MKTKRRPRLKGFSGCPEYGREPFSEMNDTFFHGRVACKLFVIPRRWFGEDISAVGRQTPKPDVAEVHQFRVLYVGKIGYWQQAKAQEGKRRRLPPWGRSPRPCRPWSRPSAWGRPAARWGFDSPNVKGALDKVEEEWQELREALSQPANPAWEEELGDLLFSLVNVARFLKSIQGPCGAPFISLSNGSTWWNGPWPRPARPRKTATLEEMDAIWEACKKEKARPLRVRRLD